MENIFEIKKNIKSLLTKKKQADEAYYNEDDPIMTDSEYDALEKELLKLKEKYPSCFVNEMDSVGAKVHGTFNGKPKIEHKVPMLSLQKAHSWEEVGDWVERMDNFLNPKNDKK